jgi:SAM-dependent methyltransferase
MKPDYSLYNNPRVAAAYAYARPAVHPGVLQRVREHLRLNIPVVRALDVGCGAGRSTAALHGFADRVVGIDPAALMMEHRRSVAPHASFVVSQAESLPFTDGVFNLITAAGSLNYVDRRLALPEIARVLSREGTLVIYDFSAGRRLSGSVLLEEWFTEFERRYPSVAGYDMDVRRIPFGGAGLELKAYLELEIPVPMTLDSYLRYVMSETRIERARSSGVTETAIREWCRLTLEDVFDDEPRNVIFDAYAACIGR